MKPEDMTEAGAAWTADEELDTTVEKPEAKLVAEAIAFEKVEVNVVAEPPMEETLVTTATEGDPRAERPEEAADEAEGRTAEEARRLEAPATAETSEETGAGMLAIAVAVDTRPPKELVAPDTKEETAAGRLAAAVADDAMPPNELATPDTNEETGDGAMAAADDTTVPKELVAPDTIEATAPDVPVRADTTEEAPLVSPETNGATPVGAEVGVQIPLLSTPRHTVAETGRMPGLTAAETPTPPGRTLPSKPAFDVGAEAPTADVGVQMPLFKIPRHTVAETGRTPGLTAAETPTPPGKIPPSKPALDVAAGAAEAGVVAAPAAEVGVQTPLFKIPRHTVADTGRTPGSTAAETPTPPGKMLPSKPEFDVAAAAAEAGAVAAPAAEVGVQIPLFKMPKQTVAEIPRRPGLTAAETPTPPGRTPPRTPPRRPPLEAAACVVTTDTATGAAAAVGEPAAAAPAPVVYS